ncbi:MAG: peptide MFS transporter [Planctomycetota bacterium]
MSQATASGFSLSSEPGSQKTLFGHPLGLYVLFFTEMWERFSFYGMKTLLVLYMINHFFWSQEDASHLLGTYAALAYGLPVVGGFIADRYLGAKRAVILGGVLLSIGHFLMAFENMACFYSALGLIIAGVGFLKPNVSTQVGALYKPGDPRRDGAFTIFYMGINLGALIGPLLCDWLRVTYGWHYGFGAAGVGMVFGLIVYVVGQRKLVEFNQDAGDEGGEVSDGGTKPAGRGHEDASPAEASKRRGVTYEVVRDRIVVLLIVFAFIIIFWTAFEQSPNAMLVWADKHTNLRLLSTEPSPITLENATAWGALTTAATSQPTVSIWQTVRDWFSEPVITSGQTQSFNPFFIITIAPVFAFLWVWLDKRKLQPSTPTKMVMGLALVALAFGVMWPAAERENRPSTVPIAKLPEAIHVDDEGAVFTIEKHKDGNEDKIYYGATRLKYNVQKHELQTTGVFTDLDRLRLLAATAPPDLIAEFDKFVDEAKDADKSGKDWSMSTVLASAPPGIGQGGLSEGEGKDKKTILSWNPDGKVLTAYMEIKDRSRSEFLAIAGDQDFRKAVDTIFLDSARFRVSVWWLIAFFMVLTMGELCISPVGLSLVTKLAPAKHVGLFMGGWFLATAVAEYTAQVFGAYWGKMVPGQYFLIFVVMCGVGALLLAVLIKPLKRMMHGVH